MSRLLNPEYSWDSTRPTDDRRIRLSDIVLLEHVETSAGRTALFILSVPIVAMISAILAFALSPNGGR